MKTDFLSEFFDDESDKVLAEKPQYTIAQITGIKQALGELREKAREDNEMKRDIFDTPESNFTSLWMAGACLTISFYAAAIGLMIAGIYWLINN